MNRLRRYALQNGPAAPIDKYDFQTLSTFEAPHDKHDWLARHAFVGLGERRADDETMRYFKVA